MGVFTAEAGKYEGLFYDDANKVITEDLEEAGTSQTVFYTHHIHMIGVLKTSNLRATPQWFASIDIETRYLDALMDTNSKLNGTVNACTT